MCPQELEYTAPAHVAFAWLRRHPHVFWVDATAGDSGSFMGFAPVAQLQVRSNGHVYRSGTSGEWAVCGDALGEIARFVQEGASLGGPTAAPHTIGYFTYDLAPLLETYFYAPGFADPSFPVAWLARYDAVLACHPRAADPDGPCRLVIHAVDEAAGERLSRALAGCGATGTQDAYRGAPPPAELLEFPDPGRYARAIERALDDIAAGVVYQVNLTGRFHLASAIDPGAAYLRLRAAQPVPFGVFLDCGPFQVLGRSPERFLRVRGRSIRTEPIKGTRRRHVDPGRDRASVEELRRDPKERAEHVMIVDLERNDLGRVCDPGTVRVPSLMRVESYATVHHLVSTIEGRLQPGTGLEHVLRSTFPGGSVTGAPKIRATRVIAELEPHARGLYTGALAWFRSATDFDSTIAIRTAVARDGVYTYHAGGGIVADSVPEREYAECWLKARAFLKPLLGNSPMLGSMGASGQGPDRTGLLPIPSDPV